MPVRAWAGTLVCFSHLWKFIYSLFQTEKKFWSTAPEQTPGDCSISLVGEGINSLSICQAWGIHKNERDYFSRNFPTAKTKQNWLSSTKILQVSHFLPLLACFIQASILLCEDLGEEHGHVDPCIQRRILWAKHMFCHWHIAAVLPKPSSVLGFCSNEHGWRKEGTAGRWLWFPDALPHPWHRLAQFWVSGSW